MNAFASLANYEVNHPDHVTMFTCQTLDAMLRRHRWNPIEHRVFVQQVKAKTDGSLRARAFTGGARAVLGLERLLARFGRPYVADGLIVRRAARLTQFGRQRGSPPSRSSIS